MDPPGGIQLDDSHVGLPLRSEVHPNGLTGAEGGLGATREPDSCGRDVAAGIREGPLPGRNGGPILPTQGPRSGSGGRGLRFRPGHGTGQDRPNKERGHGGDGQEDEGHDPGWTNMTARSGQGMGQARTTPVGPACTGAPPRLSQRPLPHPSPSLVPAVIKDRALLSDLTRLRRVWKQGSCRDAVPRTVALPGRSGPPSGHRVSEKEDTVAARGTRFMVMARPESQRTPDLGVARWSPRPYFERARPLIFHPDGAEPSPRPAPSGPPLAEPAPPCPPHQTRGAAAPTS